MTVVEPNFGRDARNWLVYDDFSTERWAPHVRQEWLTRRLGPLPPHRISRVGYRSSGREELYNRVWAFVGAVEVGSRVDPGRARLLPWVHQVRTREVAAHA